MTIFKIFTACRANPFLTVLPVKWRCSKQHLSNQSEIGHAVLRVWKGYMRAFSHTKFGVIIPSIRWVAGKTSPHWENTAKYRIPARRGALHPEILHVTQKPFDIMSVDMLGAIIPKDISIWLVVQEIARQIDHFTSRPPGGFSDAKPPSREESQHLQENWERACA